MFNDDVNDVGQKQAEIFLWKNWSFLSDFADDLFSFLDIIKLCDMTWGIPKTTW